MNCHPDHTPVFMRAYPLEYSEVKCGRTVTKSRTYVTPCLTPRPCSHHWDVRKVALYDGVRIDLLLSAFSSLAVAKQYVEWTIAVDTKRTELKFAEWQEYA